MAQIVHSHFHFLLKHTRLSLESSCLRLSSCIMKVNKIHRNHTIIYTISVFWNSACPTQVGLFYDFSLSDFLCISLFYACYKNPSIYLSLLFTFSLGLKVILSVYPVRLKLCIVFSMIFELK